MLGFILGNGCRKVCPTKVAAVRNWPFPKSIDDIISFRAFVNFVREVVPSFHEHDEHLRKYLKKGRKFAEYDKDEVAKTAFGHMRNAVAETAMLHVPDYHAAGDADSGRPLELYIDCSDFAWGAVLAQREVREGAPRPIAFFSRSLTETEQAWSTFER